MSKFEIYFSHPWNPDYLPINEMLWRTVADDCQLIIDQPEPSSEEDKPYFISRMETIMRKADVFLCCLPACIPDNEAAIDNSASGDWRYKACSPYILFELRLAQRLGLPCFVLLDRATRFKSHLLEVPNCTSVERDFEDLRARLGNNQEDSQLQTEVTQWLERVKRCRVPELWTPPSRTAYLIDEESENAPKINLIGEALVKGNFDEPKSLEKFCQTDAELFQSLRSIGLLVADVSNPKFQPLYLAAHSLMIPTIRLSSGKDPALMPDILQGHPAGYQKDTISVVGIDDELQFHRISDRASAVSRKSESFSSEREGLRMLSQRTFKKAEHLVFISHDEKLGNRELIDGIVSTLKDRGVNCWEYKVENRSGDIWLDEMNKALENATLLVALLSEGYEQSPGCTTEWSYALNNQVPVLPFLTGNRSRPIVGLRGAHAAHEHLNSQTPLEDRVNRVVNNVVEVLQERRNPVFIDQE